MMRIAYALVPIGYGYVEKKNDFWISLQSIHHARTFKCRQNRPSVNMVMNGIVLNNNLDVKRLSTLTLTYPPTINIDNHK